MKFRNLLIKDLEELLKLEEEMYWMKGKWHKLWEKEASQKFKELISEYISEFPSGCFGLFNGEHLLGALIFTKIFEVEPIPYIHKLDDYFCENGKIAYVEIFVVRENDEGVASKIYKEAEKIAKQIGCNKIAVVIYSSPVEENVLKKLGYRIEKNDEKWEIYPNQLVNCRIYTLEV